MYMNDGNKTKINLRNKSVFITGVAGFIGSSLAKRLLSTVEGVKVVGLDNMNHYYDVRLKEARLNELEQFDNFSFVKGNLADKAVIESIFEQYKPEIVVNLGAQAGVRYSITNPDAYVEANLIGFYNILEACRHSYDEGHPNKKRLALIMCPEEDSASVEWARQKDANWVNKDITSLEFVENIFKLMNWNRECRYKVLGRVANSDQGLCMLFDLEEAIMFTPKPQEYTDPLTGEMKKKQIKFFPDVYKDRIGKSYNDYIAGHQMNLFEDFIGYQGSAVLDEPEQKTDTISVPILQCEEPENIPLPDLQEQPENVQRPGSEVVEKGMLT